MSQTGDKSNGARKPDFGTTFLPPSVTGGAPPPDQAPQALDHFKRGYSERTSNREREMNGFNNPDRPDRQSASDGGGGGPQKWQPPAGVKSESGGGGDRPNNHYQPRHQQQRHYNSYNNNYNKHDDKQYTRSCTYLKSLNKPCILYFSLFEPSINSVGAHSVLFNLILQTFYTVQTTSMRIDVAATTITATTNQTGASPWKMWWTASALTVPMFLKSSTAQDNLLLNHSRPDVPSQPFCLNWEGDVR